MAIGERIHFFRLLRGMTQKYLGMALGFPEKSADVRLAQYETGSRTPKADLTAALAQVLDVSPHALSVPDIDSYVGLMHPVYPGGQLRAQGQRDRRGSLLEGRCSEEQGCCPVARNALFLAAGRCYAGGWRDIQGRLRQVALPLPGV